MTADWLGTVFRAISMILVQWILQVIWGDDFLFTHLFLKSPIHQVYCHGWQMSLVMVLMQSSSTGLNHSELSIGRRCTLLLWVHCTLILYQSFLPFSPLLIHYLSIAEHGGSLSYFVFRKWWACFISSYLQFHSKTSRAWGWYKACDNEWLSSRRSVWNNNAL